MEKENIKDPEIVKEEFEDHTPVKINDPDCQHDWQFLFKDGEGRFNYRCKKCPFGRASNEEL